MHRIKKTYFFTMYKMNLVTVEKYTDTKFHTMKVSNRWLVWFG